MPRFPDLLFDINNQVTDPEGVTGQWIKATKHTALYNARNPNHTDTNGWRWFTEVNNEYVNGNIIIYKIGRYDWFVLPNHVAAFVNNHPTAEMRE